MGKGNIIMKLINVKVMIIQELHTFLVGDLQVVYGHVLKLACKQNLSCQKASELSLIVE